MKICFIDFFAYPLFNSKSKIVFGGAQVQLYLLAKELAKDKKFSISFLTDNRQTTRQETFNNIRVYQFLRSKPSRSASGIVGNLTFFISLLNKLPLFNHLKFFISLLIQLKKINAQVYIQRAASAETGLIAIICKLLNKKFIFMVAHEDDVNSNFIKKNGFSGKIYRLGLKLADKIVCQTEDQLNLLETDFKNKAAIIVPAYPIRLKKNFKKINKRGVLWVARAETWKNPETFLKLAKDLPEEQFTMVCPPAENDPGYFKIIQKKAQKIPNLTFIKQVPFNRIDGYFLKARVFVSTSLSEGFPNTFIQAAKNMTPIVSFKVNPDGIIGKHRLGFWAKGNERRMRIFVAEMLRDNQLRLEFAEHAYEYARKHHQLKQSVINLKGLF